MGNPHPMALRLRVVGFVEEGHSHRSAAARFRVSVKFVNDMVILKRETGALDPRVQGNGGGHGKLKAVTDSIKRRLPELLNQIPHDQQIASVTAPSHGLQANRCRATDGAFDTRKWYEAFYCPAVDVYMHERGRTRGRSHHPAAQERQAMEARHSWRDRAQRGLACIQMLRPDDLATMVRGQPAIGSRAAPNATTAEAASKPRCTVSNCWASVWPRGTLIVRSRSSRSGSPSCTASPPLAYPSQRSWDKSVRG